MCDTKNIVLNGMLLDDYRFYPKMLNIKNMISPKPKKIKFIMGNIIFDDQIRSEKQRKALDSVKKCLTHLFDTVFLPKDIGEDIVAFVNVNTKKKYIHVDCMNKKDTLYKNFSAMAKYYRQLCDNYKE